MSSVTLVDKIKATHLWRDMASILFIPADVMWLAGWYCLLTGVNDDSFMASVWIIFVISGFLTYMILRWLCDWKYPVITRVLLGVVGFIIILWFSESLLVYHRLVFDLPFVIKDIWSSFSELRGLSYEFWALAAIGYIWVRTLIYTRNPVTQDVVLGRAMFDLFMILVLILITHGLDLITLILGLSIFLTLSLMSLGLSRIADIALHRGGKRLPFAPDWFGVIASISIGLVTAVTAFSIIAGKWLGLILVALTNGLLTVLRFLVINLIKPVVSLVLMIIYRLVELFYHPAKPLKVPSLYLDPYKLNRDLTEFEKDDPTLEVVRAAQPYLLTILLILVAILILILLLRVPWREYLSDIDDSIQGGTGKKVLQQLRKAFRKRIQSVIDQVTGKLNVRRAAGLFRAARIRWIYHQLELYAGRRGCPRPVAVTPLEYQVLLNGIFPSNDNDLGVITSAYQSIRYGELPETTQDVTRVVESWERLKSIKIGRIRRSTRRQKP